MQRRAALVGGALAVLLWVALDVLVGGPLHHLDDRTMLWVDGHQVRWVRSVGDVVTRLGCWPMAAGIVAGACAIAMVRRDRSFLARATATAVAFGVGVLLRYLVGRSAPTAGDHLHVTADGGFPSGHVLVAGLSVLLLASVLHRRRAVAVAAVAAALVGASVVYAFAHFPTDAIAATALVVVTGLVATGRSPSP